MTDMLDRRNLLRPRIRCRLGRVEKDFCRNRGLRWEERDSLRELDHESRQRLKSEFWKTHLSELKLRPPKEKLTPSGAAPSAWAIFVHDLNRGLKGETNDRSTIH